MYSCPVPNSHHENINTSNLIQTKPVIFRNIYVYTFRHVITWEKGQLREGDGVMYIGGFGEEKRREMYWCYNLKREV